MPPKRMCFTLRKAISLTILTILTSSCTEFMWGMHSCHPVLVESFKAVRLSQDTRELELLVGFAAHEDVLHFVECITC